MVGQGRLCPVWFEPSAGNRPAVGDRPVGRHRPLYAPPTLLLRQLCSVMHSTQL